VGWKGGELDLAVHSVAPVPTAQPIAATPPTLPQRLARRILAFFGWTVDLRLPTEPRGIIIVYPHTSNWDFVVGYLAKVAAGLPAQWLGKDTLFRGPFDRLFRWMGGIPVNRRHPSGMLASLTEQLRTEPWLWIALAPEGTRKKLDHVKSGFHRLAVGAGVPVGFAFIDWRRKEIGLHRYEPMSGDAERDLALLREVYAGKEGKLRGNEGELRFRSA
jgi:1-acyl-sn-glycerol-3-phosphate acyltransferase